MQFKDVVTLYLMIYKISIMIFFWFKKQEKQTNKQTKKSTLKKWCSS